MIVAVLFSQTVAVCEIAPNVGIWFTPNTTLLFVVNVAMHETELSLCPIEEIANVWADAL